MKTKWNVEWLCKMHSLKHNNVNVKENSKNIFLFSVKTSSQVFCIEFKHEWAFDLIKVTV